MSTIVCPNCHTTAPPGAMFCDNCGFNLRDVSPAQPATPQPAGGMNCPSCGYNNLPGAAFCENCGFKLAEQPPPTPPVRPAEKKPIPPPAEPYPPIQPPVQPPDIPPGTVFGQLVIQATGVEIPIPAGNLEVIIGREDPVSGIFPEIDLDPHGGQEEGVGRRHARLSVQGGQMFIEDLDSVNGTALNKQKLVPRQPTPLNHGDELRIGKMILHYHATKL